MSDRIRVHELAKELKKSNREVSDRLRKLEIPIKSNLSSISFDDSNSVRKSFGIKPLKPEFTKPSKKPAKKPAKKKEAKPYRRPAKKPSVKKPAKKPSAKKPAKKPSAKKPKAEREGLAAGPKVAKARPPKESQAFKSRPAEAKAKEKKADVATKQARKPVLKVAPPDQKPEVRAGKPSRKVYRFVPRGKGGRVRVKGKPSTVARKLLRVPSGITVKDFAQMAGLAPSEVIKRLLSFGEPMNINQTISDEAIRLLSEDIGLEIKIKAGRFEELEEVVDRPEDMTEKPPVVTVMGHVDHGKTLLLDAIRKTDVVGSEMGGITQHIGAYQVHHHGKPITFIDTPGHESFTAMRARGAQITDMVVLVVAADDGVMPQTIEALDHAMEAGLPVIVAVNKIDKHEADPARVRQQLSEKGLIPDDWGGDTIFVDVSAKEGTNIDHLLEMILLLSEMLELKANPRAEAGGVVVEAELDKSKGPMATILIHRGSARVGDVFVVGTEWGKIRAMFDDHGMNMDTATPSQPVVILGLSGLPMAGDEFRVVLDEKRARQITDRRKLIKKTEQQVAPRHISLENLFDRIREGEIDQLKVVIKADTQGSLEAVLDSIKDLKREDVELRVIHSGVGGVTETDVMLASASDALLIGFNVRPDVKAAAAAEHENVNVTTYQIIYNLTEDITSAIVGMLKPKYEEQVLGRVEVRQTFRVPSLGTIAGSYVLEGDVTRNANIRVLRDGKIIHDGKIASLRRFKDDVKSVASGFECGIGLQDYQDIKEGDILEVYEILEVPRE